MSYVQGSELEIHADTVKTLDVHGDRLLTGGADHVVKVLKLSETGPPQVEASFARHDDLVNSVRFSPDGSRVVTGSKDHAVRVWDPASGEAREVGRHDNWVVGVTWNDDGTRAASGSEDGTLRVWDAGGGELRKIDLGYPANSVDWHGDLIAVANGNRKLYLVDEPSGEVLREVPGATQLLWSVRISPDGRRVAWAGRDRTIRVLDLDSDDVLEIPAHGAQIWSVAWDARGERLISASGDGTAAIWDAAGEPLERVTAPVWVRGAGFAGTRLVLVGEDGVLRVLRDDGRPVETPAAIEIPTPPRECAHWDPKVTETDVMRCEDCDSVESLRLCVTCGHVGCCESQRAHGTKHWEETGHPNTIPTPKGPFNWRWCYADDNYIKRAAGEKRRPKVA